HAAPHPAVHLRVRPSRHRRRRRRALHHLPRRAARRCARLAGGGSVTEITVPDIGDFKDVEVIDVLVKPGERIELETPLITLETEKATMDVPASAAGVVKSVAVKKGDRVSKG